MIGSLEHIQNPILVIRVQRKHGPSFVWGCDLTADFSGNSHDFFNQQGI